MSIVIVIYIIHMVSLSQKPSTSSAGGVSVPTGLVWPSAEAEEKLREAGAVGVGVRVAASSNGTIYDL